MEYSRLCPMCGASDVNVIALMKSEQIINSSPYYSEISYEKLGVEADAEFGVSQCKKCEFVFASQVPSDDFLNKLYGGSASEESVSIFARPARAAYAFESLAKLLSKISVQLEKDARGCVSRPINILDVGCAYGVGSLGLARKHYPYNVIGVELSKYAREYLSDQGMKAFSSLDEIPEGLMFDGILLNDVLEHVPDPVLLVKKLHAFCHEKTVIWINVPNFIEWRLDETVALVSEGSMSVPKDFNPWEHLSYFSPKSLDDLMLKIGAHRQIESFVKFSIEGGSLFKSAKDLLRLMRDVGRIFLKKYPSEYSTTSLFVFKK